VDRGQDARGMGRRSGLRRPRNWARKHGFTINVCRTQEDLMHIYGLVLIE